MTITRRDGVSVHRRSDGRGFYVRIVRSALRSVSRIGDVAPPGHPDASGDPWTHAEAQAWVRHQRRHLRQLFARQSASRARIRQQRR